jgi:hypothetical protein
MSLYDYDQSKEISKGDPPFYGLIMAAMRRADTPNLSRLRQLFPQVAEELEERMWSPGGRLSGESPPEVWSGTVEEWEEYRQKYARKNWPNHV